MNKKMMFGLGVLAAAVLSADAREVDWNKPYIVVEPETTRFIQGVTEVDRERYFCVSDSGVGFENRIQDDEMYDYLVNELGVSFGRSLGLVKWPANQIGEDPDRPGHANIAKLKKIGAQHGSERMKKDFGANLNVAMHGAHNAYPEYMGKFVTKDSTADPQHSQYIPQDIDAAAELAANVLKYGYTDFTRPAFYEPINEPHWSFPKEQHFADWHLKTMEEVHKLTPEVKVGGLCASTCYFYRSNYKSFNGLKEFIDRTEGNMDFYSFHTYDYLRWYDTGEFTGRLQSGLPLEGSLDLVQNYTVNTLGKEVDVVISEQGGYVHNRPKGEFDGDFVAGSILSNFYPNADTASWDYEMQKRSVATFGHVSSIIANTMAFLDHPHTVQKAVPFLLVTTWSWGPEYYAQLFVPENYKNKSIYVEQLNTSYYKLFRGVNGRRVKALCSDPDLQTRAFVNGSKLYLAINNQSFEPQEIDLYGISSKKIQVRRFGRNKDFTGYYFEADIDTPQTLKIIGRETVMIVADYGKAVEQTAAINEVVCYGDKIAVPMKEASFKIKVPVEKNIDYAQLRIGLTRSPEKSVEPVVLVNGEPVDVPLEDSAKRFVDKEYAMTKLIYLDPAKLQAENTVTVSFPDGDDGYVGTAVIRAAVRK